jgi:hypothetical protein
VSSAGSAVEVRLADDVRSCEGRHGDGEKSAHLVAHKRTIIAYVPCVDEARQVLERLDRIEALKAAHASPGELLAELRALVREGEAWVAAEREGTEPASRTLAALGERLAEEVVAGRAAV